MLVLAVGLQFTTKGPTEEEQELEVVVSLPTVQWTTVTGVKVVSSCRPGTDAVVYMSGKVETKSSYHLMVRSTARSFV